jgi:hypothetical protein
MLAAELHEWLLHDLAAPSDFWRRISTSELMRYSLRFGHYYSDVEIKEIQTLALTERLVDMLQGEGQLASLKLWLPSPAQYDNDLSDYLPEELVRSLTAVAFVLHAEEFHGAEDAIDVQQAVNYVRGATLSVAHTLMLFPVGVALVQAADTRVTTLRGRGPSVSGPPAAAAP